MPRLPRRTGICGSRSARPADRLRQRGEPMAGRLLLMCLATLVAAVPAVAQAQTKPPAPTMRILLGTAKAISPHVYVIPLRAGSGEPNIGIVTGSRAVLVIDSGL